MAWAVSKYFNDYRLEVLRGNITGHSMVSIQGHDTTVPMGGPFGLSPSFGGSSYVFNQSAIAATPAVVEVASSDDTKDDAGNVGALTARVFGLDASGNAQFNDVTLLGQTEVPTADTFSAVHSLVVLTTGSENANAGTLWVGTGTFTAGIPAVRMLSVQIGHNKSQSGYYVVPTDKVLYLRQLTATIASSNKDANLALLTSTDGIQWITQAEFGLEAGDFVGDIIAVPGLPAGTHMKITAAGGAASSIITAIFGGELIDN